MAVSRLGCSGRDRRLRVPIVGWIESLSESGTERAVVDGATHLKQKIGPSPPHGSPHSELEDYLGLVRNHLPTGHLCFIGGASFLATTPFRTSGLEAPADDQSAPQSNALKTRKKNEGMIEALDML